ncbi:N-acetylglucosamine-6-phosphate deacetylase [Acidocella aromatica]|uniref:N-acetylmuramic acid 6-phosphate etherase n=1 Tax=Acidocella aromatica TaxID=1303579 RepID=A0A840VRP9_9PROT|nr:N-acetylglucosamine-6-phosphate deacetylase [Acidocella aromatica]MBB5372942.1 N-acetylmuramic acid 6-phosphate etherase/N-acetylglucosamine-6-phosphate deacetylase [Acidocella aromatica]
MIISAPRLFLGDNFTPPGAVEVHDGRITRIILGNVDADIHLTHGFLAPGLIDLHNNGAFGVDCATATPEEWDIFVSGLMTCGVTSVLPTAITAPLGDLAAAAQRTAAAQARHGAILGLHLEGPFLAPSKRGAHLAEFLHLPDDVAIAEVLAMGKVIRLVTLAPELPGALAAIARLREAGITVALGHTAADATTMRNAAAAGATLVTHVFNAQSPLHHRAPGAPGVALTDSRLSPCLIADGVHVAPELLAISFAACPRAIAVTDSILIAGLEPGTVREFGGAPVTLGHQGVGLRADGTIAGAGITLDEGVRRLIAAGVAPETALAATTSRPAHALNLADRGALTPGARADLVWFSDDFHPQRVWTAGTAQAPAPAKQRGTETAQAELMDLDERDTLDIVTTFLTQEQAAQRALTAAAPSLARLADAVAAKLQAGGRLFYAGAGTSGRLGFLDAVECGPTFGIEDGLIIPLLAGGPSAFIKAAEGAEDDTQAAITALTARHFTSADALVGIAASGSTPFTLAAIRHARALGGLTGAIVNNAASPMAEAAEIPVQIATGAEVIAGSTRLSAGSSQKIALNTLSSTVMIRLGKTYGPYMVDMRATNAKLRRRALAMVQQITGANERDATLALTACGMHVKCAALMILRRLTAEQAQTRLAAASGSLRRALQNHVGHTGPA